MCTDKPSAHIDFCGKVAGALIKCIRCFVGRIYWSSQRSRYDDMAVHWSPALPAK